MIYRCYRCSRRVWGWEGRRVTVSSEVDSDSTYLLCEDCGNTLRKWLDTRPPNDPEQE